MRVSAIIEARMGSSRLPGKVLAPIQGRPMIAYLVERVKQSDLVDTIVVATPSGEDNKPLWEWCESAGLRVFTGPEDDVLSRVLGAAEWSKTDVIVELTADCPVIDASIIDLVTGYYICAINNERWDFVGNVQPRTWPRGMDVRVFSTETLSKVDQLVRGDEREAYWREHVSPRMYEADGFKCKNIAAPSEDTYPDLNLSVDTREDLRRVSGIIETQWAGNQAFNVRAMLEYLATLPGYEMLHTSNLYTEPEWAQSA